MRTLARLAVAIIIVGLGEAHAQELIIEPEEKFCAVGSKGQRYRGCEARKFPGDFYYRAYCPDLEDPEGEGEDFLLTDEWTVIREGEPDCPTLIAHREELPYFKLRSANGEESDPQAKTAAVVRLLYGTNRVAEHTPERTRYTGERDDRLHVGVVAVSVPAEREIGEINRPWSLRIPFTKITISLPEDPQKHFAVRWIGELSNGLFVQQMREAVGEGDEAGPPQAFVFIHGYNTPFDAAAFRTAQLAHDLRFPGAPIFFSWPSRGEVEDYEYDQQSVRGARRYLTDFLTLVREHSGAEIVHLIAHSMGNDPLMEVLRDLRRENEDADPLFNEIVLAAPDIDRDLFFELAGRVRGVAEGVTLYANRHDRALDVSRRYAGNVQRAGDLPPLLVDGIDTIDVTSVGSALFALNHNTYADSPVLLGDLKRLLLERVRPERRPPLIPMDADGGRYWQMPGE